VLDTFIKSRLFTVILVVVAVSMLYQNLRILYYNINYSQKIKSESRLVIIEEKKNKALNEELIEAGTVLNVEQKARTILGLVKQNEVAYKIVRKKGD
jgi:hypothetical protein